VIIYNNSKANLSNYVETKDNNFDLLRLVGALLVIWGHSYLLSGNNTKDDIFLLTGFITTGQLGVAIFFSISGYLITCSLSRSVNIFEFILKRALRIFPALICAISAIVLVLSFASALPVLDFLKSSETHTYFKNMFLYFPLQDTLPGVFLSNPIPQAVNGSLWSLVIEFSCYLVLAISIFLSRSRKYFIALVLMFCLYALWEPTTTQSIYRFGLVWFQPFFMLMFFIGAAIKSFELQSYINYKTAIIALILSVLSLKNSAFYYVWSFSLPILTMYVSFLSLPTLKKIKLSGDYSYGLYLYSFPIQQLIVAKTDNQINTLVLFISSLLLTLIPAYLSWNIIEKPAINFKKMLKFKNDGFIGINFNLSRKILTGNINNYELKK
jgi:peptidoglycan/LPS O-acetylase OafA/YrhL